MISPFHLYQEDKSEFLKKVCAICLTALYYPETDNKMKKCCRFNCWHAFHQDCANQLFAQNHTNCPECREPIRTVINTSQSLELAIRNDAFNHGNVDEELQKHFSMTGLNIRDYPYHKIVFERWRSEVTGSLATENEVTENEVTENEVTESEVTET